MLRDGKFADDVRASRSVFRELRARFAATGDYGPVSFANQALLVDPEGDAGRLRQDAVGAVAEFVAALRLI